MKAILLAGILISMSSSFAMADDSFVPSELGLTKACAEQIVRATIGRCDDQSKKAEGKDREHQCITGWGSVNANSSNSAVFELTYTAGDSDEYTYNVDMKDKSTCDFSFGAEQ